MTAWTSTRGSSIPAAWRRANEFQVNTSTNTCANPVVAVASDNTFTIVWGEKNMAVPNNGWDIYGRQLTSRSSGGAVLVVNSQLYGDQSMVRGFPRSHGLPSSSGPAWPRTARARVSSGQYLRSGTKLGVEFQVNTTFLNSQINPAVASDGVGQFLACLVQL